MGFAHSAAPAQPMTRIFVTGNAGSGKTTFARRAGAVLGLPVAGLDRVVWQPGWRKSTADERAQGIALILARPGWVAEGVSGALLEAADVVVFLDMPRRTCLLRCARRNWRYLFRSRPELPPRCPEVLIVPRLVRLIWNFPATARPQILTTLAARANQLDRIVRNDAELEDALAALAAMAWDGLTSPA
jgi:adenylate kinase family enzyme